MKLSIIALAGAMLAAPLLAFGSAQAVTINSTTPTSNHLVGGSNTQTNVHDGNFLDVRWGCQWSGGAAAWVSIRPRRLR